MKDTKTTAPAGAPLVKTEVQDKATQAHIQMVHKIGVEIIQSTGQLAGKYLELCLYIRRNKVGPKLVSQEMTKLGFKRSRVSEVNRVANSSDKLFSEYQAKLIGFDKCLEMARIEIAADGKETKALTEGAKLLSESGSLTGKDLESATAESTSREGTHSGPTTFEKVEKAMMVILEHAHLLRKNKLPMERHANGFSVELIKIGKTAANV